ncbi:MAG: PAS domain S-box protein [Desulforhopalus sp.]
MPLHLFLRFTLIFILVLSPCLADAAERGPAGIIRVGIFNIEPFNMIDAKGVPHGLNVDLLQEISRLQKWTPEFVPVNWAEGLDGLQKEELDLMVSVAYSQERAEVMDYGHESVAELWGQVFVRPEGRNTNIDDLAGKRIGVMSKDISGINFIKMAKNFGVLYQLIEYPSHAEVFAAVQRGDADAGVAPQHFGLRHAKDYNLVGSSIMFSPFSIFFASKKGAQHELLGSIDSQLTEWKRDKDSYYYDRLNFWMGSHFLKTKIPSWLTYTFVLSIIIILGFAGFTLLLNKTVKRRTKELKESETKFRSLAESSRDSITRYDRQGRITYMNPAGLAAFDKTEGEILGKTHKEIGFPEERDVAWETRIKQVFEMGEPYQAECSFHGSAGMVYLDWHLTPEYDSKGEISSVLGVSRDITERTQLEKIQIFLAETSTGTDDESFFYVLARFLARNLGMDFVCIDRLEGDGLIARTVAVWCDGQFKDDVSYALKDTPCGEVVDKSLCCYPENVSQFFPNDIVLKELQAESYVGVPLLSHTGSPIGLIAVIGRRPLDNRRLVEATLKMVAVRAAGEMERLDAEIALRQSEEQYRLIFTTAQEGIWGMDAAMQTIFVNPRMAAMLGYEPEEMMGSLLEDYFFQGEDPADHFQRMRERRQGRDDHYQCRFQHKDGHSVWTSVSATAQMDRDGCFFGSFGMFTDITEHKQAEEEKKALMAQLLQAQKMEAIGTLAGGIAHDFNNILGAIIGYAEMIQDDCPVGSSINQDIKQILKAGNRAKDLVKQILAFSRQAKAAEIHLQPAVITSEAVKMLRASLPATIKIEQNIDPDAGVILADPTQIHQIMMNLCTNAFHAMENDGGTLTISLQRKELFQDDPALKNHMQPGNYIQLSIKDVGTGIDPEILGKIYDPYFTTKEVGKGTGMGLAMVHGIVQSSGGSILCKSQFGKGTVFHITLPVVETHLLHEIESAELIPAGLEHILLIDDEEMLIKMSKVMLERLGYRVTTRMDSNEALATFRTSPKSFDLVITDQTMPGLTGTNLARHMLQIRPDIPIILCTGYSSNVSEEEASSIGIKAYALKPLAKKDIGNLIRKVLDEAAKN